jgi:hypothetical protein
MQQNHRNAGSIAVLNVLQGYTGRQRNGFDSRNAIFGSGAAAGDSIGVCQNVHLRLLLTSGLTD